MVNRIFAVDTDVFKEQEIYDYWYDRIRPERRERVDRMRFENGKFLSLGAAVVMEHALSFAGCGDREIVITPEGKPTVEGCFFNLSHSGEIAICAVSDREVGIDIERPRELTDGVIHKAFTETEIRAVGENYSQYVLLWTIKESVMKWTGLGLGLMPENIEITLGDPIRIEVFDHPALQEDIKKLQFTTYRWMDYRISVCSEYPEFTSEIAWLDDDIYHKALRSI